MGEVSDRASAAVLDALSDVLAGPVTSFVGMVNYLDEDGEPSYATFTMESQRLTQSLGLARGLTIVHEEQMRLQVTDPD